MSNKAISLCVLMLSSIWCGNAFAENALMKLSDREGGFEIILMSNYVDSKNISGQNGSSADIQDSWGWGFGFGYNFSEHWAFNFDIGWRSSNYDATIVVEDNDGALPDESGPQSFTGMLDTTSSLFSLTYNFMDKRFTPYVSGIFGWTFVDTNVPTGPPQNWCWYDPWYGYICSSYVPTHSETPFSYGGTLGLRFDVGDSVFLRAAYNKIWIDFENASAEDFDTVRLDIGFLMK